MESLINSTLICSVEQEHIRPFVWKVFLEQGLWLNQRTISDIIKLHLTQRKDYGKKVKTLKSKKKFSSDPGGGDTSTKQEWKQFYQETEVKKIGNLDLVRTYPDKALFQSKKIIEVITNIILIWTSEHPEGSYRQGMNEIAAVIIISIYPYYFLFDSTDQAPTKTNDNIDQIKLNEYNANPSKYIKEIYNLLYNPATFEADVYLIFNGGFKHGLIGGYDTAIKQDNNKVGGDALTYKKYELFSFKSDSNGGVGDHNVLKKRCDEIIKNKLRKIDERLFNHFVIVDLNCFVFLQKWIKGLFNREFETESVVLGWDCIIGFGGVELEFIDYLCVEIGVTLRDKLIGQSQDDCFQVVFDFAKENKKNVKIVIAEAKQLYDMFRKNQGRIGGIGGNKYGVGGENTWGSVKNHFSFGEKESEKSNQHDLSDSHKSKSFSLGRGNGFKVGDVIPNSGKQIIYSPTPISNVVGQTNTQNVNTIANATNAYNTTNTQESSGSSSRIGTQYLTSALSSFGSLIKGVVNMDPNIYNQLSSGTSLTNPQSISNSTNISSQTPDDSSEINPMISFQIKEVSAHVTILEHILQQYKATISEQDQLRLKATIHYLKCEGKYCGNSSKE